MPHHDRFELLIAGNGPAALEAALALQPLAGHAISLTLLTPDTEYLHLPMTVLSPFAACGSGRQPLSSLVPDARVRAGELASVDVDAQVVRTATGDSLAYDALLVAVGGVHRSPYRRALTFGRPGTDERMHGLIQDLEDGYVRRVAFVVAPGVTWPLPLYELALLTAERAYGMCVTAELTFVTPEEAPLAVFGAEASRNISDLLDAAEIRCIPRAAAQVHDSTVLAAPGVHVSVDRVITLPVIEGPAIAGLPHDESGFLPIDRHGRVTGTRCVYAAGDATNFPIKHGGLACRQADAAAEAIAADAGMAIEPRPYVPVLQAVLATERETLWLERDLSDQRQHGKVAREPQWSPSTKLVSRELARHLRRLRVHPSRSETFGVPVGVNDENR